MRWRMLAIGLVALGTLWADVGLQRAEACPMCKQANKTSDARPRAYLTSILFMLAVPATMLTGFGIGFYRLSRMQPPAMPEDETDGASSDR